MMTRYSSFDMPKDNEPINGDWERDEFLAMVSHEICNSTNIIISWAELICRRQALDETLSQGLEAIRRCGQLQARLIRQLIAFSGKKSGDLWSDANLIALRPILETAIKAMTPQALAKGISIHTQLGPAAGSVIGDASHLEEVFTNLLSNAIKFTPAGGRIELQYKCWKGRAQITVSDTGRGISAAFLPHVFDRFRQEKVGPTGHNGLGLGLAIVRYLVEKHQGNIYAFSRGEGKGATFTVCFPLASTAAAQTAPVETCATSV
jgi:two-component system, chemotaxis family, CheB/CheR fusion protein